MTHRDQPGAAISVEQGGHSRGVVEQQEDEVAPGLQADGPQRLVLGIEALDAL